MTWNEYIDGLIDFTTNRFNNRDHFNLCNTLIAFDKTINPFTTQNFHIVDRYIEIFWFSEDHYTGDNYMFPYGTWDYQTELLPRIQFLKSLKEAE